MSNEARQGQPTPMDPHRQRWLPTLALLPHYCPTACTRTQILQQPRRSHATHCPAAAGLLLSLEQAAGCCACAWARCQGTSHSHTHSSTHIARALKPQWCSQHHPPPILWPQCSPVSAAAGPGHNHTTRGVCTRGSSPATRGDPRRQQRGRQVRRHAACGAPGRVPQVAPLTVPPPLSQRALCMGKSVRWGQKRVRGGHE